MSPRPSPVSLGERIAARADLVRLGAMGAAVLTAGLAVTRLVLDDTLVVAGILAVTALGFATTALGRLTERAPWGLALVGWLGVSAMAFADGGLASEALFWLAFAPLLTALAGGRRSIPWIAALSCLTPFALVLGSPDAGWEPRVLLRVFGLDGAVVFAALLGVGYERYRRSSLADLEERNEKLEAARALLRLTLDNLKGGVAITDERGRVVAANDALCDVFGLSPSPEELVGGDAFELIRGCGNPPEDVDAFRERLLALARANVIARGDEVEMSDGRVFQRDFVPVDLGGGRRGHVWSYYDVTARATNERRIRTKLDTDPLTGAASRAYFERAVAAACAEGTPFSLAFVDLDGFKLVNDEHGHDAGDAVLCAVVERARDATRRDDVLARMGGDEFAVLFAGLVEDGPLRRACEKLITAVSAPLSHNGVTLQVGASVGAARFPADADDPDVLTRAADEAMYRAKRAGKGRVRLVGDDDDGAAAADDSAA